MQNENTENQNTENELQTAETALEKLQKRRVAVAEEADTVQSALEAAQRAAIDGSGSTAQLTKKRAELDTLRDLLGALDTEIEGAQFEYNRLAADARRDEARATLESAARQRTAILEQRRQRAARAAEIIRAELLELDATHHEIAALVQDAREAFDALVPNVTNKSMYNVLSEDERARVDALINEMRAENLDPNVLANHDFRDYVNDVLQYQLYPDADLPREIIAARHANDGPTPIEHGEAHYAALANMNGGDTLRRDDGPTVPTVPIFNADGTRDYVAESLANGGRVAGT